jgi:hypothetical protein
VKVEVLEAISDRSSDHCALITAQTIYSRKKAGENQMRKFIAISAAAAMCGITLAAATIGPDEKAVPVQMTVTANVEDGKRAPQIAKEDVFVNKGKERLGVADWVAARGDRAGLELFILIDDASITSLGIQLKDLRDFIKAQPPTTSVGVGYARNAVVEIRQNFTTDHELAAKALRLPVGFTGAYGSAYLSVVDLMKRWPATPNRREVLLIADGIDRARRAHNALLNPDVDTAAAVAQRTGTMIHSIYYPGVGHWHRNFWWASNGQNGLAKLSDQTGGESFYIGSGAPVSFAPYLKDLQKILDNQYLLTFHSNPGKKAGLQFVNVSTEIPGVDFATPDAVWVPAAK